MRRHEMSWEEVRWDEKGWGDMSREKRCQEQQMSREGDEKRQMSDDRDSQEMVSTKRTLVLDIL